MSFEMFAIPAITAALAFAFAAIAARMDRDWLGVMWRVVSTLGGLAAGGMTAFSTIDYYCSQYYGEQWVSAIRVWDVRVWLGTLLGGAVLGFLVFLAASPLKAKVAKSMSYGEGK